MTAVELARREGPPDPKWERAKWEAGPVWARLDKAGIGEGDLVKLDPPIYLKKDRPMLTTTTVDAVCVRALSCHPFDLYGPAWFDDVDGQEELWSEWAS